MSTQSAIHIHPARGEQLDLFGEPDGPGAPEPDCWDDGDDTSWCDAAPARYTPCMPYRGRIRTITTVPAIDHYQPEEPSCPR